MSVLLEKIPRQCPRCKWIARIQRGTHKWGASRCAICQQVYDRRNVQRCASQNLGNVRNINFSPQRRGSSETLELHMTCAMFQRTFTATYERATISDKYKLVSLKKDVHTTAFHPLTHFYHDAMAEYPEDEFDNRGWRCPWCQAAKGWFWCLDCGMYICKGHLMGLNFL